MSTHRWSFYSAAAISHKSKLCRLFANRTSEENDLDLTSPRIKKITLHDINWLSHLGKGDIEVYDSNSGHNYMDMPEPLAEIGGILTQKLYEIN
ncbi:hypothetical protein BGZ65_003697, partial [Modicella reniformis]